MGIGAVAAIVAGLGAAATVAAPYFADDGTVVTPKAAPYEPIDFGEHQIDTIMGNYDALPYIEGLTKKTNNLITDESMRRAKRLIPGYKSSMKTLGNATGSLLNGQIPYEDALGIVSDRAELANGLGIPGTSTNATLKDLGISRLGALNQGAGLLGNMVSMAEQISPRGGYANPQSMMLQPSQTLPLAMQQAQLEQQSGQNVNNLGALAASDLTPGPNPVASIGAGLSGIGGAIGTYGATQPGAGGGYGTRSAAATAAPYASGISYAPGIGYTPQAAPVGGYSYFSYGGSPLHA